MTAEAEKRWEWESVEPGPRGEPFVADVTPESIAAYARRVRNENPAYLDCKPGDMAMPTAIFNEAPLRRNSVAQASGFVALEWVKDNPRQTPFAKCTARWFAPIRAGDTLTSTARVIEKYERRGNKFVTFRVEAINQDGVKAAEYDYTCIFEYAQGQKPS
jgi:acyl dehydratase